MAFTRSLILAVCSVAVTACDPVDGVGEGNTPVSKIVTLSTNGVMPAQNFAQEDGAGSHSDLTLVDGKYIGYSYAYGLMEDNSTFLGVAALAPNQNVGGVITTGSASYDAVYSLAHLDVDSTTETSGNIVLTADLGTGELRGQDGKLSVYGSVYQTNLGGTVVHDGLIADLRGSVGNTGIVGAFAGNSDDEVLVGGFVGNRN